MTTTTTLDDLAEYDSGRDVGLSCGHAATPSGIGAGYAVTHDGRTLCYPCADAEQRAELTTATTTTAYLSGDGRTVTTWTGGELMRVTAVWQSHPWARRRYLRAVTPDGARWHGSGPTSGDYVTMHRSRATV